MSWIVDVEGCARSRFDCMDSAIQYAKSKVYMSPEDEINVRNYLSLGHIGEYSYGFSSAIIYPPRLEKRHE